ncbi:MAG: glycerol-3-phosphate dehydrogenase [Thermoleophilaceae bacterium]|jgi:glycerol-3-phosphate dehydrogenase (NAD(P)+)|nr:glycerol-3-phosphate dehydrogenase [Thermoleophilaceae bacterium]
MRHPIRRASVVGAGSFGTAIAVLLERSGVRTTLLCRTEEQAAELESTRRNEHYLDGVELPGGLKVRSLDSVEGQFRRVDAVFLAVPSRSLGEAADSLAQQELPGHAGIISCSKGLVPPDGIAPTLYLEPLFGPGRIGCIGGPAHAREMVESGAGLVCASHSESLAHYVADAFQNAGIVCEVSNDPVGVELAGAAKNAAALAAGATIEQGYNAAGMAAGDVFAEVLALATVQGGRAETFVGRAGIGDLMATALAPSSRNRAAGELLAQGVPAADIPERLGQVSEALETVSLLARASETAQVDAPVISALSRLIEGTLPLDDWVALVRTKQPDPARFEGGLWRRVAAWFRRLRARRRTKRPQLSSNT